MARRGRRGRSRGRTWWRGRGGSFGGGAGTGVSSQLFAVTKVSSLSPPAAAAGATITIGGQGLASATAVDFAGHAGVAVAGTPTATAGKGVVPRDATTGVLTVHTPNTDPAGVASAAASKPLPKLTGVSPLDGKAGTSVTITGTNLLAASAVKFGAVAAAAFAVDSATQV